jgi:xylan 1,4-beta-xylosidase
MNRNTAVFFVVLGFFLAAQSKLTMNAIGTPKKMQTTHTFRYKNPITRDFSQSLRDNMILKVGKRWYMTGTSQPVWSGPNPGVRLMVSDDLLKWKDAGWIIDASKLPKDCPYNGRFWAPEIHQINGKFYLTVNSGHEGPKTGTQRRDNHRIWIFSSNQIDGKYTQLTSNGLEIDNYFTNDATLFADDDGRTYLYCNGYGLYQAEIDLQTGKLLNENNGLNGFIKIIGSKDPGNPDWMSAGIEGPFVIKRYGSYWMFFSSWTRGYEVGVMQSASPLGPWKLAPNNPIFGARKHEFRKELAKSEGFDRIKYEDTKDPYVEVGHNAVFEGPDGKDWICCHYWVKGKTVVAIDHLPLYAETREQLGIDPLHFENGQWSVNGPTWKPQKVSWK